MTERKYVDGRLMRYGYTTGSCAAAAAKAATSLLLSGVPPRTVLLSTPKGKVLNLLVEKAENLSDDFSLRAKCAIRKDAGDDPDVTHGILIFSEVSILMEEEDSLKHDRPEVFLQENHEEFFRSPDSLSGESEEKAGDNAKEKALFSRVSIRIDGGEGIGRVTKRGLDQPPGAAAINTGPRTMIRNAVLEAIRDALNSAEKEDFKQKESVLSRLHRAFQKGVLSVEVVVSAPGGELLGRRTFNPMMGIEGGISILGTTGIVEPMSDQAIAGTIEAEVSVIAAAGHKKLMINLGNYGENFTTKFLGLSTAPSVKCANFIGVAVDAAVAEGLDQILLIGHIGKLVKLGISMFNTHSNNGDGRLETFAACAVEAGLDLEIVRKILSCATTEAAIDILDEARLLEPVLERLKDRIQRSIERHIPDSVQMEFICFSGKIGQWRPLFQSEGAGRMSRLWKIEES